jgi:hypothetical protein
MFCNPFAENNAFVTPRQGSTTNHLRFEINEMAAQASCWIFQFEGFYIRFHVVHSSYMDQLNLEVGFRKTSAFF